MEDEEHSGFGDGLSSRNGGEASRSLVCGSFDFQRDNRDLKMVVEEKCSECSELKVQYDFLMKEQLEVKRSLEDVKRENEVKSRECREAWGTLHELQMELMCKSMHVGSLAFAVEGRVKEKSRWFLSLEELSKKFEVWDATTGQRQYLFEGHDAPVYSICPYCKESIQFIFSTAIDGKIKAWLYDCLGSRVDYNAPGLWCTTMAYSADGTRFACNLLRQGMHQICLSAVSTCLTVEDSKEVYFNNISSSIVLLYMTVIFFLLLIVMTG